MEKRTILCIFCPYLGHKTHKYPINTYFFDTLFRVAKKAAVLNNSDSEQIKSVIFAKWQAIPTKLILIAHRLPCF